MPNRNVLKNVWGNKKIGQTVHKTAKDRDRERMRCRETKRKNTNRHKNKTYGQTDKTEP